MRTPFGKSGPVSSRRRRGIELATRVQEIVFPAALVSVIVLLISSYGSSTIQSVVMNAMVTLVLVIGFYLFAGNSGIISFGHMAFMGVGAYAAAIVSVPTALKTTLLPQLPRVLQQTQYGFYTAVAIAAGCSAVFALLVGPVLMRLTGLAAGIGTMSLVLAVQVVVTESESWTRGNQTMIGIPANMTLGHAFVIVLISMAICYTYQRSKSGLLLRSVRDDELAAASVGVRKVPHRTLAFVLSAAICGAGGAMLAFYVQSLTPNLDFFLTPTFTVIAMLVIGGMRSFSGAVIGTVIISAVNEVLRELTNGVVVGSFTITFPAGMQSVTVGVLTILMLMFRPGGIMGTRELGFRLAGLRALRRGPDTGTDRGGVPVVAASPAPEPE